MPEYAFAVDVYGNDQRWVYVQEYAAPETVAQEAASARRDEALSVMPEILQVPAERMHLRVRRRQKARRAIREDRCRGSSSTWCARGRYRFLVNFTDYLDTGLFLDHRLTRRGSAHVRAGVAS